MIYRITPLLAVFFLLMLAVSPLGAQNPCTIVYGGGLQEDGSPFCMEALSTTSPSPTAIPQQPRSQFPSQANQTKGGLSVQPAPTTSTQPATGPEAAALFAILPAGALGWFLRKSAQG